MCYLCSCINLPHAQQAATRSDLNTDHAVNEVDAWLQVYWGKGGAPLRPFERSRRPKNIVIRAASKHLIPNNFPNKHTFQTKTQFFCINAFLEETSPSGNQQQRRHALAHGAPAGSLSEPQGVQTVCTAPATDTTSTR